MMARRRREQNAAAAVVGRYGMMIQLDYPSSAVKSATDSALQEDRRQILAVMRPQQIVHTHNPADKHDAHVGVAISVLQALRDLPREQRPAKVWGCEVWRNLDWLPDDVKVLMDVSAHENLAAALNGVFDSQIAGGKRYDLATLGRRRANATFLESHAADRAAQLAFGIDLTLRRPTSRGTSSNMWRWSAGPGFRADEAEVGETAGAPKMRLSSNPR